MGTSLPETAGRAAHRDSRRRARPRGRLISAPTPGLLPALLDGDEAAGLHHRGDDRLGVERAQRAQVDHLGVDAELFELGRRLGGVGHADGPGDDRHILAGAMDARLADGQHEVIELRHLEALPVEDLVLKEDDGFGSRDRGLEQALGIGGRVGRNDLEAGNVRVPGRIVLAVLAARRGPRRRSGRGRR